MRCMFPNCKCDLEGNGGHVCPEGMEGITEEMVATRDGKRTATIQEAYDAGEFAGYAKGYAAGMSDGFYPGDV